MKKLIGLLFLAVLILAGCSNSSEEDVPVVNWMMIGKEPTDHQMVEDAMNEILVADYGVKVDFTFIDYAAYADQVSLKLTAGEEMDIIFAPTWVMDYTTYATDGYYYDMTELVQGSEIYDTIDPAFWEGVTVDGKIYGVPTNKELAVTSYVLIPEELVAEYNLDVESMDSMDDLIPYAKEYTANTGKPATILDSNWKGLAGGAFFQYDCLSNLNYQVCLDLNNVEAGYQWVYDIPEYVEVASNMNDLIDEGVLAADPTNLVDWSTAEYAFTLQVGPPGSLPGWEASLGRELVEVKVMDPVVSTEQTRGSINVISATSTQPEAAFTVLEAVNTNPELRNLMAFGIEGVHYNLTAEGQVEYTEQGQQNYMPSIYTQGNYSDMYTVVGEPIDKMDQIAQSNAEAVVSPALGFAPDLSEFQAQIGNILNIFEKYKVQLMTNDFQTDDIESEIASIRAELESVGMYDVIDDINRQYEEFLASKS